MKQFTSKTQKIGLFGEKIAKMFLMKHGFSLLTTNYTKKTGEIDIVGTKDGVLHFIEVKTIVSREKWASSVSCETPYSPFQNMSKKKYQRFLRTCEIYLLENNVSRDTKWMIDVIAVTILNQSPNNEVGKNEIKNYKIETLWNIII